MSRDRRHRRRRVGLRQGAMLALAGLFLVWGVGWGAEDEEGAYTLGTVYVVEHRDEQEALKESSPHHISVIPEHRLTGTATSVAELLSEEVGVRVNQAGGMGSFSMASIRGSSGEQVTVLLDGIPLNQALGGGVNLGTLPTSILDSIEVYRGSSPIHLGVTGIGGVINIKTRRARNKRAFLGQTQYGSFGSFAGSLFYADKPGAFDFSLGYEHRRSDNDFEYLNHRGTLLNPHDDRVEKRRNNAFRSEDVSLRGGYDLERIRLDLVHNFKTSHKGLPGPVGSPTQQAAFDSTENLTSVKAEIQATEELYVTVKGFYARKKDELDDRLGEVGGGRQDTQDVTSSTGGDVLLEYPLGRTHNLSVLGRAVRESFEPEDALSRITVPESRRLTVSGAVEDRMSFWDDKIMVAPAVRFDHVENDLRGVSIGKIITGKVGEKTYDVWSPQISVKYAPWPFVSLRTNLGQYHRFPSFLELFGNNGTFLGNVNLEPEKGANMDVGIAFHHRRPTGFMRYGSVELVYFKSRVKNIVSIEQATGDLATATQQDEADISGVEASFRLGVWDRLHLSGNVTYQEAINRSPVKAKKNKQLPQRPLWEVDLWARVTLWKLEPFYNYTFIDKNYLNATNLGKVDARHLHSAGVTFRPLDWVSATVEVKNITDKTYEDFFGFPLPGRSYHGTLKVAF